MYYVPHITCEKWAITPLFTRFDTSLYEAYTSVHHIYGIQMNCMHLFAFMIEWSAFANHGLEGMWLD